MRTAVRLLPFFVLLLAGVSASRASIPKNRVGEFYPLAADPRPDFALQVPELRLDNPLLYGETASGRTFWTKFDPEGLYSWDDAKALAKANMVNTGKMFKGMAMAVPRTLQGISTAATHPIATATNLGNQFKSEVTTLATDPGQAMRNYGNTAQHMVTDPEALGENAMGLLGGSAFLKQALKTGTKLPSARTIAAETQEAVELTTEQTAKLNQFNKKTPANATPAQVDRLADDQVLLTSESAGRVPGSKKVYQKSVAPDGETTSFTKTTITPDGRMDKVTDALENPEKVIHTE